MSSHLQLSMFHSVLLPKDSGNAEGDSQDLALRQGMRFPVEPTTILREMPIVVFDFETTGLDNQNDRVIEIGAIKILGGQEVERFEGLYSTDIELSEVVQKLTGISDDMLKGKPKFETVLPDFLQFIKGSILCAHNADFDMGFLKSYATRANIDLDWPAFCTYKMARELLADLERKNLDTLAEHYGLQFEARHRSIGDVKVTIAVLNNMLENEGAQHIHWKDFEQFYS